MQTLNTPTTKAYWDLFYVIQGTLVTELTHCKTLNELNSISHNLAFKIYNENTVTELPVKQYKVISNNVVVNTIESVSYDAALLKAAHMYGLEIDIKEI